MDRTCPRCNGEKETINHILFECPAATQVWNLTEFPRSSGIFPSIAINMNFDYLLWRAQECGVAEKNHGFFGTYGRRETKRSLTTKTFYQTESYS